MSYVSERGVRKVQLSRRVTSKLFLDASDNLTNICYFGSNNEIGGELIITPELKSINITAENWGESEQDFWIVIQVIYG